MYEELDYQETEIGGLMLRRRRMHQFGDFDIYEVKLGEDFLMTNLFHESESQLSIKGLEKLNGDQLDIVVGGLGLGHTAVTALEDPRISKLTVIEFLKPVIGWHQDHLVPMGKVLTSDKRCQLRHADFFAWAAGKPEKQLDAILLDIDHTPTNVLNQTNTRFYTTEGLTELSQHLKPNGVFGLWADGKPEPSFVDHLKSVFTWAESHLIEFPNPITGGTSVGTVYLAKAE